MYQLRVLRPSPFIESTLEHPDHEPIAIAVVRILFVDKLSMSLFRKPGIISFSPAKDAKDFPGFLESQMALETKSNLINGQHDLPHKDSDEDPFQLLRRTLLLPQDRLEGMLHTANPNFP